MKKIAFTLISLLLVIGLCSTSYIHASTSDWYDKKADEYKCPVTKESVEWRQTASNIWERKQLFHIPEEIISKISTENLLKLVLEYPYLSDVMYYENYNTAIEIMSMQYNGIDALLQRKDAGSVILDAYKKETLEDTYASLYRNVFFEAMLAQKGIFQKANIFTQEQIIEETKWKNAIKTLKRFYRTFENVFLKTYEENCSIISNCTLEEVGSHNSVILSSPGSGNVSTPSGNNSVYVAYRSAASDESESVRNMRDAAALEDYGGSYASLVSGSTKRYNCHFYAWLYKQYSLYPDYHILSYWLSYPWNMITDSYYTQYNSSYPQANGHILVMYSGSSPSSSGVLHSAYTVTANKYDIYCFYVSKWGPGPLMRHTLTMNPYYVETNCYRFYKH